MDEDPKLKQKELWKPFHWADKIVDKNKCRTVNLQYKISDAFKLLINDYCNSNKIDSDEQYNIISEYSYLMSDLDSGDKIEHDEYVFEFGDQTVDVLCQEMEKSFKMLWDGSISIMKDTILASKNNKIFV